MKLHYLLVLIFSIESSWVLGFLSWGWKLLGIGASAQERKRDGRRKVSRGDPDVVGRYGDDDDGGDLFCG